MGAATIALLGPLAVNGDTSALSPRDRVVLSALAVDPVQVSSVERLADALWGAHPPTSWPKVVPGCIHRIRRVLGTNAIETTPHGYRLTITSDQIDIRRFEHLLRAGRELLATGEADRAAGAFEEAVGLWRGGAFLDLDRWEPGQVAAMRLTELRLQAQECLLDAMLQAGRHAEVLAPARAAAAEAPLREQRWGQLALAQYRCGRQGEALQTLRRARHLLATELGLDPGPELLGLEAAILRHDPALAVEATPVDSGECPYLGLVGYDVGDADTFFGREWEVADCVSRLRSTGVLAVVGPSGCGKSSLTRAGVAATFAREGRPPVVVTPGSHPMSAIAELDSVGRLLIVDQAEEVFANCADPAERAAFCAELAERSRLCRLVISLRADYLGDLAAHPDLARLVERGLYLLGPMDPDALRAAIVGPAERVGLTLEPGLVDLLARDVEGQPGALPLLSHALRQTWERRTGRTLTVEGYQASGGIRGSVAQSAERLYESLTDDRRRLLRQVVLRLISTTDDGDPVRTRVPRRLLLIDPAREAMVEQLISARLVTADRDTVQVAHECLAVAWPRLSTWLDDDVEGRRIQRHLTATANAWDALGRPDSELYRGARLAQTLDWRRGTEPTITTTEIDFLTAGEAARDAEQRAVAEQARQRARMQRRNRTLLAGVVVVVIGALVAGLLALRQQRQREAADLAAQAAEATRLDEVAKVADNLDESLLLAVAADRVHDSPDTRDELAALLSSHPDLIRSVVARDTVRALAVSPDSRTLVVGEGDTGTAAYRTDTLERTATFDASGWTIAYRPDGQQMLLAGRGGDGLGVEGFEQLSAAVSGPQLSDLRFLSGGPITTPWLWAADAAYSADGGHLVVYAVGSDTGAHQLGSAFLVWDSHSTDAAPVALGSGVQAMAVALSSDGTRLYVLTEQPALAVYDVATDALVDSLALPQDTRPQRSLQGDLTGVDEDLSDALEVSPDGSILAIAENHDVALLDSGTLTERARLRGHHDRVQTIEFSPDGHQLATGGVDREVNLWDVGSGGEIAQLTGHGGAVLALAFSPDGRTLYSGGTDHRVLVWDLAGSRRFITRVVAGLTFSAHPGVAVPAPDGRSVVFAGADVSRGEVHFLDVASGLLGPAATDPHGGEPVVWVTPDDRSVVTVAGDRSLRRWDRDTARLMTERAVATAAISALAADPGGPFLVVGDRAGTVARVDAQTLTPIGPTVSVGRPVTALAVLPDGRAVALLDDSTFAVVDLIAAGTLRRGDLGVQGRVAAASVDGTRLVVGGTHGEVGLYSLADEGWIAPPQTGHTQYVVSAAFNRDGTTFVTTSLDGGVRIWDGRTGESIARAPVSRTAASVVVLDDGVTALIAGRSGDVYRVDTDFTGWISAACSVAGRELTAEEWTTVFRDRPVAPICSHT